MRAILLHGYNVSRPEDNVGELIPTLKNYGIEPVLLNYGELNLIDLRPRNNTVARLLKEIAKPGDILITHSNGAAIAYEAAMKYDLAELKALIMFNPALNTEFVFPNATSDKIVVMHNKTDAPVLVSKLWRTITKISPLSINYGGHLWGAAGRDGFKRRERYTAHIDMSQGENAVKGHSAQFRPPEVADYWMRKALEAAGLGN